MKPPTDIGPAPLTVADVLASIDRQYPRDAPLPAPAYWHRTGSRIGLAVPSMERHMSNEGWQLMLGLREGGYELFGGGLPGQCGETDVGKLLDRYNPAVVFVQDQHEWDQGHLAVPAERFFRAEMLAERQDVFKVTVVKDVHRQYVSARDNSTLIGCHAWVVYYHPALAARMLSWLRPEHLVRTYHTIDAAAVPTWGEDRRPCVLSGSLGGAYPLRERVHREVAEGRMPGTDFHRHPGYSNKGTSTNDYLRMFSCYKVAVCTSSRFGYLLRKIIEATACGCIVVTDLPSDEVVPEIDANLVRVHPSIEMGLLKGLVERLAREWDGRRQCEMARLAMERFDYRVEGERLAEAIEEMRKNYRS